jgi:hypothetical protein
LTPALTRSLVVVVVVVVKTRNAVVPSDWLILVLVLMIRPVTLITKYKSYTSPSAQILNIHKRHCSEYGYMYMCIALDTTISYQRTEHH